MKTFRRTLLAAMSVAAIACSFQAAAQDFKPRIIRFGYGLNEDSNQGRATKLFAQEVEKASGGKMKIRAIGAAALCAYAAATKNFWLLVAATVIAGYYNANAALYRFAGPELVAPEFKERAISLVLAGGIIGAFAGPNLANATRSLMAVPFVAAYLSLVAVGALALLLLSLIRFAPHVAPAPGAAQGRPLGAA